MWDPRWEERPRGGRGGTPSPHPGAGSPASRVRGALGRPGVGVPPPPRGGRRGAQPVASPRRRPAVTLSGGGSSHWSCRCARRARTLASHRCRSSHQTCCSGRGLGGKQERKRLSRLPAPLSAPTAPRGQHGHPCLPPGAGGPAEPHGRRRVSLGCRRASWKDRGASCSQRMKMREEVAKEGLSGAVPITGHLQDAHQPQAQGKAPTTCDV